MFILGLSLDTKKAVSGFPAGMDAPQMHLSDVSYSLLETSQRGLICKCLRRLPGD